jgi:hypothetical protein
MSFFCSLITQKRKIISCIYVSIYHRCLRKGLTTYLLYIRKNIKVQGDRYRMKHGGTSWLYLALCIHQTFSCIPSVSRGVSRNPLRSHKKHTLPQCVRHYAATLWQQRTSGILHFPQPAIWREWGECLTAELGMKCPQIDKYLAGNQCSWSAWTLTNGAIRSPESSINN